MHVIVCPELLKSASIAEWLVYADYMQTTARFLLVCPNLLDNVFYTTALNELPLYHPSDRDHMQQELRESLDIQTLGQDIGPVCINGLETLGKALFSPPLLVGEGVLSV